VRSWLTLGLLVSAVSGCESLSKGDFVISYTTSLCEHELMCGDQALLTYDGILDVDDCIKVREHEVGVWGQGCRFRVKDAEVCLADMAALTCPPAEGTLADRPLSCEAVYFSCEATPSTDDTEEEPQSTPEDSDASEG